MASSLIRTGVPKLAPPSVLREHHVGVLWRLNTAQHVNVVVSRPARPVHGKEYLRGQPAWIHIPADPHAPKVNLSDLFKTGV